MKKLILLIVSFLVSLKISSAYIDPGTGGMVIGSIGPMILAAIAAVGGFFVKVFWKPIKKFFLKIKKSNNGKRIQQ